MNRFDLRLWASGATAATIDPDLDASHPSGHGGPGKYALGWVPEKEPHQWINFLYGAQEEAIGKGLSSGIFPRESSVSYKLGALTHSPTTRVMQVALVNAPTLASHWGDCAAGNSKSVMDAWVSYNTTTMNTHIGKKGPTQNAHNTTVGQAGGYTKEEANTKNNVNLLNINNHKANNSNPHQVSYVHLGALSATLGGTFTGTVNMSDIKLTATTGVRSTELYTANEGFGITSVPWLSVTGQEVLTENSYPRLRNALEPSFALPPEDIFIPLEGSLSSLSSGNFILNFTRPSTLSYTDRSGASLVAPIDEPAFGVLGMKLSTDYVLQFIGNMSGAATVSFELDGQTKVYSMTMSNDNLRTYLGTVGNVKNLRIWLTPLTTNQKTMLGANNG